MCITTDNMGMHSWLFCQAPAACDWHYICALLTTITQTAMQTFMGFVRFFFFVCGVNECLRKCKNFAGGLISHWQWYGKLFSSVLCAVEMTNQAYVVCEQSDSRELKTIC